MLAALAQCVFKVIRGLYIIVDVICIATPYLGLGLNHGPPVVGRVQARCRGHMNRRTRPLPSVKKGQTLSIGAVPANTVSICQAAKTLLFLL